MEELLTSSAGKAIAVVVRGSSHSIALLPLPAKFPELASGSDLLHVSAINYVQADSMKAEVFVSDPVLQVLSLYDGLIDEGAWTRTAREQIEQLADRLLDGHRARLPGAAVELHNWLPNAGKRSTQELFDHPLSSGEALDAVARAHGFASWQDAEFAGRKQGDPVYERTIEDLLVGDIQSLVGALDRAPDLVVRRSHYGHRATLLYYVAANGVETYRQRVPLNVSNIAAILVQRGADVLATASIYRKNQTVRGLLLSSGHPRAAGVTDDVLAVIDGAARAG